MFTQSQHGFPVLVEILGKGCRKGSGGGFRDIGNLKGPSSHFNTISDPTFLKQKKLIDIHSLNFLESSK